MNKSQLSTIFAFSSMIILLLSGGGIPFLIYRKFLFIVVLIIFGFLVIRQGMNKIELQQLALILVFILAFLVLNYFFAITPQSIQKVLANVTIMFSSAFATIYFSSQKNKGMFVKTLYFSLKLILFHSLLNFIAYPLVSGSLSIIGNWHYECSTFANLFFYNPQKYNYTFLGISLVRNQGLFWEPGVLQIFLNIFLFLNLFVVKSSRFMILVIIFSMLTTLSTTGLFIMLILMGVYSVRVVKNNILFFPIVLLILFGLFSVTSSNISNKIYGDGSNSFQVRLFDLVQPFKMVADNPLTGIGLDDQQFIEVRNRVDYALWMKGINFDFLEKGSTNSITFFLATSGIPATILLLYLLYNQLLIQQKKKLFFVLILFSLMTEPLLLKPFFFIFVISGGLYFLRRFKWKTY